MNFRSTRLLVAALIILGVVVTGFAISVPHTKELAVTAQKTEAAVVPAVTVHDVYKKGTHTITGTLLAPDACTSATADATLLGDASSTQTIALAVSMPEDSGVCLMRQTQVSFSTTLAAPANLPFEVTVNGVAASSTLK